MTRRSMGLKVGGLDGFRRRGVWVWRSLFAFVRYRERALTLAQAGLPDGFRTRLEELGMRFLQFIQRGAGCALRMEAT